MFKLILIISSFFFTAHSLASLLDSGLEISVAGDLVHNQGLSSDSTSEDRLKLRGAEVVFYAPIDHQFDAVLSLAAHEEVGRDTVFEVHEMYIEASKIFPRSTLKYGQFFLGFGRLNRSHQHDWVFTRAPKVHRTFFAEEGVFDSGFEYSYLFNTLSTYSLTLGVTNGYDFGHSHGSTRNNPENKPKSPTHYARFSHFTSMGFGTGIETGVSYIGRTDANGVKTSIAGIDFVKKTRHARRVKHLLQSEFWYKSEEDEVDKSRQLGLYVFNDHAWGEVTSFGYRLDIYKDLTKENALTGKTANNISYGTLVQGTYYSSEFAKIRATLSHEFEKEEGDVTFDDTRFALQFIFILGSHPAHDF